MAPATDPHDFPADSNVSSSSHYVPRQPWAQPAPANGRPEGHREDIPPPIRGTAGPAQEVDVAYQGIINHRPQPFANPRYVFPDVGHVQDVSVQGNQDLFGYFPQNVGPGPPQAAFPQQLVHRDHLRCENLRQLAHRYLDHPGALVRMVSTEEGTAGGVKAVIILETPNVP